MSIRNTMQIFTSMMLMCNPKKEGPTDFQEYRYENKKKSTKDRCMFGA